MLAKCINWKEGSLSLAFVLFDGLPNFCQNQGLQPLAGGLHESIQNLPNGWRHIGCRLVPHLGIIAIARDLSKGQLAFTGGVPNLSLVLHIERDVHEVPPLPPGDGDGAVALQIRHRHGGNVTVALRQIEAQTDESGLQTILQPLRHALFFVRACLVPLAATPLDIVRLYGSVQLLRLPEALGLDELLRLIRDVRMEIRGDPPVGGLLVPAHFAALILFVCLVLGLRWSSGGGGVVELHTDVLGIGLELRLVGSILLLVFLCLLDELGEGFVLGIQFGAFLCRLDGLIPF
mmetsp:Transcript_54835/g.75998  ORF Transcript_54835/g.75998 Transcript_54835/m.75998 type:complete len:290 (+) Transcript_54835:40-909(+)